MKPVVALVPTGGTITAVGRDRLDLANYLENETSVAAGSFLETVPEVSEIASIREVERRKIVSHALAHADWVELVMEVRNLLDDVEVSGVVIMHGTNTLEETAYLLSLTLPAIKPVVVVGAMRPASGLSSDGPLNLLNAVRVVLAPESSRRGVQVVMNDAIFSPRDVTKGSTYRVNAFVSPDSGPVGYADADGQVVYYHRAERQPSDQPAFSLSGGHIPRVDVVASYVGADGVSIDALVDAGAVGIVSAGTGAGRPTPSEMAALERASERGVVICQSSRVGGGRVVQSDTLADARFVASGNLGPWKSRVLLALALTETSDPKVVQDFFDRY